MASAGEEKPGHAAELLSLPGSFWRRQLDVDATHVKILGDTEPELLEFFQHFC